jgi:hypothetical protein
VCKRPRRARASWLGGNVDIRTRRATGAACWEISIELEERSLGGRSTRNAGSAGEIEMRCGRVCKCETHNRRGSLQVHSRRRLRDGRVANVANLAVIFAVPGTVPMDDGVGDQQNERQQGRKRQQPPASRHELSSLVHITPARRRHPARPFHTAPGSRKIRVRAAKSIPPRSRWRKVSVYRNRSRWKVPPAAGRGRRPARSS